MKPQGPVVVLILLSINLFPFSSFSQCPSGEFSYFPFYCVDDLDPTPSLEAGAVAGTFSSIPTGLIIDAISGEIDLSESAPGIYEITNLVDPETDTCDAVSFTYTIEVAAVIPIEVPFTFLEMCQGTSVPFGVSPPGGLFTIDAGCISFEDGFIIVDAEAPPGCISHIIYTTADICPATITITIEVSDEDPPDPFFSYASTEVVCNDTPVFPEFISTPGGIFTISEGATINPSTGLIDFSISDPGLYEVTYVLSDPCYSSYTTVVNYIDATSSDFLWAVNVPTWTAVFTPVVPSTPFYLGWDFGDGSPVISAPDVPLLHVYDPGVYEVCLTALWYGGCIHEACHEIVVGDNCSETAIVNGLSALSNPAGTGVALSWNPLVGATHYQVQGRPVGAPSFAGLITTNNYKNVGGLSPGTDYEWRVRAKCEDDAITDFSPINTFTTFGPDIFSKIEPAFYDFYLSPNPAEDEFVIRVNGLFNETVKIELLSLDGRSVLSKSVELSSEEDEQISVGDIPHGMYLVKIQSSETIDIKTIFIK